MAIAVLARYLKRPEHFAKLDWAGLTIIHGRCQNTCLKKKENLTELLARGQAFKNELNRVEGRGQVEQASVHRVLHSIGVNVLFCFVFR